MIRKQSDKGRPKKEGCQGKHRRDHETKDWDPEVECFKCCEVQWEGAIIKDRRWRERGRDEEYEVFIVSSWAWVWSSWPGDLLCSVLLRVLLHSLWPICQMASLCVVLCPHMVPHVFDLTVLLRYIITARWNIYILAVSVQIGAGRGCRIHIGCCGSQTGAVSITGWSVEIVGNPASGICVFRL